ncbi:MAG TPA: tetratricopeptide repeat protein [Vicinamibacterales bacterium]|nr:tetratricopeptide repeat protein [Vicinamibacterales bacterium]
MTFTRRLVSAGLAATMIATSAAGRAFTQGQTPAAIGPAPAAALVDRAYTAAYNLDHDEAVALAKQAIAINQNDPDPHRALAAILWLNILFRRGAVTVDHFMGGVAKSLGTLPKPPAELDAEFHRELDTAIRLAEARLAASPKDIDASYGLGSAYGLQASYAAAVEGSTLSAFKSARRAYDVEEEVLERDPNRAEAAIIVGTYRYIVSTLAMPSRWVAYMAGFGGDKNKGIALVEAALKDREAHVDASAALILIYTREGRHDDALQLLRELEKAYPRNRLFVLERGGAAIRAGHAAEAEAALTQGLSQFERDTRAKIPGERAFWLYKRAMARVLLKRVPDAEADLRAALDNQPVEWVRGRIHLELGKAADLQGKRDVALGEYRQARTIADANNDAIAEAAASRFERRPYGG